MEQQFYVGSYGHQDESVIHSVKFNGATGQMRLMKGTKGIENASFLTVNRDRTMLYAVSEKHGGEHGSIVSFTMDSARGHLKAVTELSTLGGVPCHLVMDKQENHIIVTNYSGGNVCSFGLGEDGTLVELVDNEIHTGRGPRDDRQEASHPHSAIVDPLNRFVLVADLGTDKIVHYRLEGETGRLIPHRETNTAPGAGPRHLVFHPTGELLYVVNELDSTVVVYRYDAVDSMLQVLQVIRTLPESFEGESTCADIHITSDGRYLYASNRGHDSLAVYRVVEGGKLELVEYAPCGGSTPRNFAITADDRYVVVANQSSDTIVSYSIDQESGKLMPTGHQLDVKAPVCIIFF
ncbi:6-phosphogluconolactonase [Paenibacillus baekrokdamisoli]|uniref:6-phosphogluconolactonase n=1 Tax=Paenibacillus baekrokdamisoli TaxID=1712516 RepID=A0A3G9IYC9_9BACL|nr:lactonase family protein [Paenibacillus baekrokdamisoli]MBB3072989.1 6-phosphogluconolactonase [Paenibacillus baekrokdamisoli]BBH23342.1 6-phosphogluconolactonase [Paenibacillus baekrokdamisoli]